MVLVCGSWLNLILNIIYTHILLIDFRLQILEDPGMGNSKSSAIRPPPPPFGITLSFLGPVTPGRIVGANGGKTGLLAVADRREFAFSLQTANCQFCSRAPGQSTRLSLSRNTTTMPLGQLLSMTGCSFSSAAWLLSSSPVCQRPVPGFPASLTFDWCDLSTASKQSNRNY